MAGLLLPRQLVSIFNSKEDAALAAITVLAVRIYFIVFVCMGVNICCISYFQSILQSLPAAILSWRAVLF